jgi:hypothetical protein
MPTATLGRRLALLAACPLLASAPPAAAQSDAWARMAETDLEAAYEFLIDTHPGAVRERGDEDFLRRLESGRSAARAIAAEARSFGAYRAALQRFAAAFGDPHIASDALVQAERHWPGIIVSNRSGEWRVVAAQGDGAPAAGAKLLSCDGRTADELAEARLAPFTSSWAVRAQRIRAASGLLVDSGNPLQPRLESCRFEDSAGRPAAYRLQWRAIDNAEWGRLLSGTMRAAGEEVSLRPFEGGWWLRLGSLSARAAALVEEARGQQAALRSAPFVVVDLRGNSGGASFISDRLAEILHGSARVADARRPRGPRAAEMMVWRASPRTLDTANAYVARAQRLLAADDPVLLGMIAQRDSVSAAVAAGQPLARAPAEIRGAEAADRVRRPPRLVLVTDRFCFSSCLQAASLFRALGALHVGEETSANTRYSNLISMRLPSGLSTFSSMQAYSTWTPARLGPYAPQRRLEADLADDAAVQEEVSRLLAERGGRR